ncbi:MAG: hypothetical protein CVV27_11040 [Candidatus Melainabacteria bacterium HGW-Melainabacteria-1]|nr:MAG: hypothetical protein CVV27_11040 [Candidatus Melainabacteria bacterium HGW-Melainabacteria-1]
MNLTAALLALGLPELFWSLFYAAPLTQDPLLWRHHIALWGFVLAMGLGYGLAARDPGHERGILLAGGIGKLLMVGIWTEMLLSRLGTWILLSGMLWDGVLGALFLLALLRPQSRQDSGASSR